MSDETGVPKGNQMKIKYEVYRRGGDYRVTAIDVGDGGRMDDEWRTGDVTEKDIRELHDIEFPEYEFGGVDWWVEAEVYE